MPDPRFYRKEKDLTLQQVLQLIDKEKELGVFFKDKDKIIKGVGSLLSGQVGEIAFCQSKKYEDSLRQSKVSFCFVLPELKDSVPNGCLAIPVGSPMRAFAKVMEAFYPHYRDFPSYDSKGELHSKAVIAKTARISFGVVIGEGAVIQDNAFIGPYTVIGPGVIVGEGTQIGSHATIEFSLLGKNVRIGAGTRSGGEGFGFVMDEKGHVPVPQLGRVLIEDGVEIGANCTIDRGALDDTIISVGTRIDNLVHLAHNVKVGRGCVIVAQVGIAGSTQLGDYVAIGGQAGLTEHLTIGARARIAAQSGVMRNVEEGETVSGSPAVPISLWRKQNVILSRLGAGPKK